MFADSCRLCHLSDVNDAQLVLSGPKYAKKISHIPTGWGIFGQVYQEWLVSICHGQNGQCV